MILRTKKMRTLPSAAAAASLLLLFSAPAAVRADKDDSYYNANSGNPNVDLKMYWKDAKNILQDLSKFGALYVEYHSCVWSWMDSADTDDDIDENDYWYMGSVPSMGANVAFSLYGSLKGQSFSGCNKNTFINSFFTTSGFESFAYAMYYASQSSSSFYSYTGNGDYSSSCQGGYGVGCDSTYGFAVHSYSTSECDPKYATGATDTMSNFNSALSSSAQCVQIYDSSSYSGYTEGTALELLDYSSACNYMNMVRPDGDCPDPYGWVAYYVENFDKPIQKKKRQDPFIAYEWKMRTAKKKIRAGIPFFVSAFLVVLIDCIVPRNQPKTSTKKTSSKKKKKRSTRKPKMPHDDEDGKTELTTGSYAFQEQPSLQRIRDELANDGAKDDDYYRYAPDAPGERFANMASISASTDTGNYMDQEYANSKVFEDSEDSEYDEDPAVLPNLSTITSNSNGEHHEKSQMGREQGTRTTRAAPPPVRHQRVRRHAQQDAEPPMQREVIEDGDDPDDAAAKIMKNALDHRVPTDEEQAEKDKEEADDPGSRDVVDASKLTAAAVSAMRGYPVPEDVSPAPKSDAPKETETAQLESADGDDAAVQEEGMEIPQVETGDSPDDIAAKIMQAALFQNESRKDEEIEES